MPVPAPIAAFLNSLTLVGLPEIVQPGESFSASITPNLDSLQAFTSETVLMNLNSTFTIDAITLNTLLDNFKALSKQVEFANVQPGDPAVVKALPFLDVSTTPPKLSPNVEGALTSFVGAALTTVDKVTANVTGALKAPPLVDSIDWQVQWIVKDDGYRDLGTKFYAVTPALGLKVVSTVFNLLPAIAEYVPNTIDFDTRFIGVNVTVTTSLGTLSRQIGPFGVKVVKIALPAAVAFSQHALFQGFGLIGIPQGSPLSDIPALNTVLKTAQTALNKVSAVPGSGSLMNFAKTAAGVGDILSVISLPQVILARGDVKDLGDFCYQPGWFWCNLSAYRQFSAMALIGVGHMIQFFNLNNWWVHEGVLSVRLGPDFVASDNDFSTLTSTGTVNTPLPGWNGPGVTNVDAVSTRTPPWNDAMGSFKWDV